MLNSPFSPWPSFTSDEAEAVSRVLLTNKVNYWTGDETRMFEREFAEFSQCEFAVALANGTLALELALHALEIGEGDEVIVTPRTFIASASTVANCGGIPVFADIDEDTQALSAETIEKQITHRTKAIIVVHLAGIPADMDPIISLAEKHDLKVIEDCAQAHGARYKGRSVGSIGHIGAWSFCQDKIMSTGGEGGMVTTNDKSIWQKMWSFKDHGKSWEAVYERKHESGYRWVHESFGTNMRMTEMQAVIGRLQLKKMPEWHRKRVSNTEMLMQACRDINWIRIPKIPKDCINAAYKAYVFVQPENLPGRWGRDRIIKEIESCGVPVMSGSCSEVYMEKAFDGTNWRPSKRLPVAKLLGETALMFLVHPTLTINEMKVTCSAVAHVDELIQKELSREL